MYICSKEDTFIAKTKVEIGEFFEKEKAEVYVILKEPSTNQFMTLQTVWKEQDEAKVIQSFYDMLPELIVDSNIYETDEKKMGNKELAVFLFNKFECITDIMKSYYEFLGEAQSKKKKPKPASKQ